MLPKFITNVRVQSVGLSMRSRGGDGTSALGVVGVKSNFSELVDNQSFYLLRNLSVGVCVLTYVVFVFPTFIPRECWYPRVSLVAAASFVLTSFVLPGGGKFTSIVRELILSSFATFIIKIKCCTTSLLVYLSIAASRSNTSGENLTKNTAFSRLLGTLPLLLLLVALGLVSPSSSLTL